MRYVTIFKTDKESDAPPTDEEIAVMGQFIGEMAQAGVLLAADGLQPSSKGAARVRYDDGKFTVTDGPFAETKELIAGFAILQVNSKDEAIAWTKRFLSIGQDSECEVRLMHDEPAYPPASQPVGGSKVSE